MIQPFLGNSKEVARQAVQSSYRGVARSATNSIHSSTLGGREGQARTTEKSFKMSRVIQKSVYYLFYTYSDASNTSHGTIDINKSRTKVIKDLLTYY